MAGADGLGLGLLPPATEGRIHRMEHGAAAGAAEARPQQQALHHPRKARNTPEPRLAVPRTRLARAAADVAEEVSLPPPPGRDVLRHQPFARNVLQGRELDPSRRDQGLLAGQPAGMRLLHPERRPEDNLGRALRPRRRRAAQLPEPSRRMPGGRALRRRWGSPRLADAGGIALRGHARGQGLA